MTNPILNIHNLTVGYSQGAGKGYISIVKNVNETVQAGELICLIGPNGAGKSTLLRTLAGMQPAIEGTVWLMGQDIRTMRAEERARQLSLVLTHKLELDLVSGYTLVAMGRSPYTGWMGQLSSKDHDIIQQSLQLVGAQKLANRMVNTMSDGERQKILIARALAQEPHLMILDEPTAFLDLPRRVECISLLRDLAHHTQRAIVLSIHDLDLALRCADRIWLLPYDGKLRVGVPEDLVLSGAFQRGFENMGVQFDIETGTFLMKQGANKRIALIGHGVNHFWTQRALEREGFSVQSEPSDGLTTISLMDEDGTCRWIVDGNDQMPYASLGELLETLSMQHWAVMQK